MIFLNYSYLLTFLQTIVIGAGGLATAILAMWGLWMYNGTIWKLILAE